MEYEYRDLLATTWDLLRGDTSKWEDRLFYLDLIDRHGQPVLDVGCGTGRLLLDYLGQGMDVDGVDNSPEMLAICREKAGQLGLAPVLYEQTMESLALPRTYRTILVPSSSFQLVTDPEIAGRALTRLHAHLAPGGALAMSFMILWEPGDPQYHDWKLLAEVARPEDGALIRRWARTWFDEKEQLEYTENRYEVVQDGEVTYSELHRRSPATRWYSQEQVRQLYGDAGFADVQLFKGFTQQLASENDTLFTAVGRKA